MWGVRVAYACRQRGTGVVQRIRKVDGEKLRAYREDRWWTQQELAAESGVNRMTIGQIERGENGSPRRGTIKALAGALGLNPNDLLEDRPLDREQSRLTFGAGE